MNDDTMPAPKSVFELRTHLAHDHENDQWGGNWTEYDAIHTEAHAHTGAGHTHEPAL